VRTLDRYLIRQILPPFLIALGVFTFILDIMPILDAASRFLAKGVSLPIVGTLLFWLLPSALGLTLPMAFLTGLLIALGRLSGDREAMAMLACGVSPLRLFRPVLVAAIGAGLLTLYVMVWLLPDCNQRFNGIVWQLLTEATDQDIKPGLFYEGFAGKVLYLQSSSPAVGWSGVLVADTSQTGSRPSVALAERGQLFLNKARQQVVLSLGEATQYLPGTDARVYDISRTASAEPLIFTIAASDVFPGAAHGFPEMSIAELKASIEAERRQGTSGRQQYFFWQQKFSFPVACIVFALLALPIGLHTRKEGQLAGLVVGLAIISVYFGLMKMAESVTKGNLLAPVWARWVPDLVLGPIGLAALWWRARASGLATDFSWRARLMGWWRGRWNAAVSRRGPVPAVAAAPGWSILRLLDSYVGGMYLRILALSFFGLLALYYIGAFLDVSERLFKHQATTATIIRYLWYSTPQFVTFVVPMATLVAVLGTIGGLTRTNELTVMRACGISLYRAAWPLIALALAWSGLLFGIGERVLAPANLHAEKLKEEIRTGAPVQTGSLSDSHWLAGTGGRVFYYAGFDTHGAVRLSGLSVFETDAHPYRLRAHTYAGSVVYRDGAWHAGEGWVQQFSDAGGTSRDAFADRELDLPGPDVFSAQRVDTSAMTFSELSAHIRRLEASGFSVTDSEVKLQTKVAFPLVTLVMTLLGIPFGLTTGRRGAMYGIGLAIVLAFFYWLSAFSFVAAGSAGLLPAALAAWATNILFLAIAGFLVLTVRT
jgi:LPS export ABC transporter permease LptG/LPS export ABC transporter permease LptF